MSQDDEEHRQITASLKGIIESGEIPADDADDPSALVLRIHKSWRDRGGTIRGKRRNSDRQLTDLLTEAGKTVASLTPKLNGRTRLTPDDAGTLIECFLVNWDYHGGDNSLAEKQPAGYSSPFSRVEVEKIRELLLSAISDIAAVQTRSPAAGKQLIPEDARDLIIEGYQKSDALFTVSTLQTLIVLDANQALIGFRNLLNRLWSVDKGDNRKRALIWIVDLGGLSFDDDDSQSKFINVESLATRFKAMRRFDDKEAEQRWEWLKSQAIVVVRTRRLSLIDEVSKAQGLEMRAHSIDLPKMTAENLLFSAIPDAWAAADEFRTLYGRDLGRIGKRTYTIFYSNSKSDTSPGQNRDLRYYALAQDEETKRDDSTSIVRGLELPPPDTDYDEAYRTVKTAAFGRLGLENGSLEEMDSPNSQFALLELRALGFVVLRLEEFLKL